MVFSAGLVSGFVWAGSILFRGTKLTSPSAPSPFSRISLSRCSTMSLYGLSLRYAPFKIFSTWSGILAYIALSMNCWASGPKASLAVFWRVCKNLCSFCVEGLNLSASHSHLALPLISSSRNNV